MTSVGPPLQNILHIQKSNRRRKNWKIYDSIRYYRSHTWVFSLMVTVPGSMKTGGLLLTSMIVIFTRTSAVRWISVPLSIAITFKLYLVVFGDVKSGSRFEPGATRITPVSGLITNLSSAPLWIRYTNLLLGDERSLSQAFTCVIN